jgi:hypothetical protein
MSFVVNRAGGVSLVTRQELPAARSKALHAFQSYAALLVGDGQLPRGSLNRPIAASICRIAARQALSRRRLGAAGA